MNWKQNILFATSLLFSATISLPADAADWAFYPSGSVRLTEGPIASMLAKGRAAARKMDLKAIADAFQPNATAKKDVKKSELQKLGPALSALCRQYAQERNEAKRKQLEKRIDAAVDALARAQKAGKSGFLQPGADAWLKGFEKGEIQIDANQSNAEGGPFLRVAELFGGLRDAYRCANNEKALEIERESADALLKRLDSIGAERVQKMLGSDGGPMTAVLIDLSEDAKDPKYADAANRIFYPRAALDSLKNKQDETAGLDAAFLTGNLRGLARMREARGDFGAQNALDFFLNKAYVDRMNSNASLDRNGKILPAGEAYAVSSTDPFDARSAYDIWKLGGHGFLINVNGKYFEYSESAMLNGLLPAFRAKKGAPSATELLFASELPEQAFSFGPDTVWLNHFMATELVDAARGLKIRVESDFPNDGKVVLRFSTKKPQNFTLRLRKPSWAQNVSVLVNGKPALETWKDFRGYIPLRQVWKNGDVVELNLTFKLWAKTYPSSKIVSFFYGPLLLGAAAQGAEPPVLDAATPDEALRGLQPGKTAGTFLAKGTKGTIELSPILHWTKGAWTSAFSLK